MISRFAAVLLLLALAAHAQELKTNDGLALRLDKEGRTVGLTVDGRELLKPGAAGGFFVADVKDVPVKDVELLANPSFEQVQAGKPTGWNVGSDWSVDEKVAHSGKASMKVAVPGPDKRSSGSLSVEVPVKPNTPYRVSMWLRTDGGAPHLYIVQMDAEGKTDPACPQICVSHGRNRSDWFELSRSFMTASFCRKIQVRTSLWQQTGTAWVDDVSVVCLDDDFITPQKLAAGTLRQTAEGIEQTCEIKEMALRLKAHYKAKGAAIAVDCDLEDTSSRDRAVTVSFRLPIDAVGWNWSEDIHRVQAIEDGIRYGSARLLNERSAIGLYPFSAMGDGKTALALAVPMDMPRMFRICYDRRSGYFVNYEFGLSRDTAKFPGRAWFRFLIYRTDPAWGLRSAAKRYYELFPQFFVKRVDREGGAGFMADRQTFASPDHVAPGFAIFNYQKRESLDAHRRAGVRLFSYTEFAGWWGWAIGIKPEQAEKQPSPEEAWAHVEKLARSDPPNKVAQCILNCSLHDRDGKRRLHANYEPKWGGYNYICNPDPEIEGVGGRLNRYTLTRDREVANVDAFKLDGMYYDCAFVFAVDDFRREHFKWADDPLIFDHVSKKPAISLSSAIYECAKAIADDMHKRGKLVMANYSVTNLPTDIFCIQFIDVIGNEMLWTWCADPKLALQRTLADQKTVSMSWQEAKKDWALDRIEREMKQAMFYGTFYYLSTIHRDLWERWAPVTERLAKARWQPITCARSKEPCIMVERFGGAAGPELYFALRNPSTEAKTTELQIDADSLGLSADSVPEVWLVRGSRTFEKASVKRDGRSWVASVTVPANDTVVLRVSRSAPPALPQKADVPAAGTKNGGVALGRPGVQADQIQRRSSMPTREDPFYPSEERKEREAAAPPKVVSIKGEAAALKDASGEREIAVGSTSGDWRLAAVLPDQGGMAVLERDSDRWGMIVYATTSGVVDTVRKSIGRLGKIDGASPPYPKDYFDKLMAAQEDVLGNEVLAEDGDPSYAKVLGGLAPLKSYTFLSTPTMKEKPIVMPDGRIGSFGGKWGKKDLEKVFFDPYTIAKDGKPTASKLGCLGDYLPAVDLGFRGPVAEAGFEEIAFATDAGRFVRVRKADGACEYFRFTDGPQPADRKEFYRELLGMKKEWDGFFSRGMTIDVPEQRVMDTCRACIVRSLITYVGPRPKYGHGAYGLDQHDTFPPTTISMGRCLLEWGFFDKAKELLGYYLKNFVKEDGTFAYYGPAVSEYGQVLDVIAMCARRTGDREWLRAHRAEIDRICNHVLSEREQSKQKNPKDSLGHGLIWGSPEADTRDQRNFYFSGDAWCRRGLLEIGRLYAELGRAASDNETAERGKALMQQAEAYREDIMRSLRRSIVADGAPPFLPPVAGFDKPFPTMTADNFASYTNYRYWLEMLSAGLLDDELSDMIVNYRLARGGELLGMTRFAKQLDDWPYADYAWGILARDRVRHYLLGYYAHMAQHMTRGTFTAYEQVPIREAESRDYVADHCVPSQLVTPLMTKWMLVCEERDGDVLWLNRAAPRAWHEEGKRIEVKGAPTRWGAVSYEIVSSLGSGAIRAVLHLPSDALLASIRLRIRAPRGAKMKGVEVGGKEWTDFDAETELIRLPVGFKGDVEIVARF